MKKNRAVIAVLVLLTLLALGFFFFGDGQAPGETDNPSITAHTSNEHQSSQPGEEAPDGSRSSNEEPKDKPKGEDSPESEGKRKPTPRYAILDGVNDENKKAQAEGTIEDLRRRLDEAGATELAPTQIEGRVVDIEGLPIGGAAVSYHGEATTTKSDGRFTLEVPQGWVVQHYANSLDNDYLNEGESPDEDISEKLPKGLPSSIRKAVLKLHEETLKGLDELANIPMLPARGDASSDEAPRQRLFDRDDKFYDPPFTLRVTREGYIDYKQVHDLDEFPLNIKLWRPFGVRGVVSNAPAETTIYLIPLDPKTGQPNPIQDENCYYAEKLSAFEICNPSLGGVPMSGRAILVAKSPYSTIESEPFELQPSKQIKVNLSFEEMSQIDVQVIVPNGQSPADIPVSLIKLYPEYPDSYDDYIASQKTGEKGTLSFTGLEPGHYAVDLGRRERTRDYRPSSVIPTYVSTKHIVNIERAGISKAVTVDISHGATLMFKLTREGSGIQNVFLHSTSSSDAASSLSWTVLNVDEEGRGVVCGLPVGSYSLAVDRYFGATTQRVIFEVTRQGEEVRVEQEFRRARIKGQVHYMGVPLSKSEANKAKLYYYTGNLGYTASTYIEEDGTFNLSLYSPVKTQLLVVVPGYASEVITVTPPFDNEINIPLQRAEAVHIALSGSSQRVSGSHNEDRISIGGSQLGDLSPEVEIHLKWDVEKKKPVTWLLPGTYTVSARSFYQGMMLECDPTFTVYPGRPATIALTATPVGTLEVSTEDDIGYDKPCPYVFRDEDGKEVQLGSCWLWETNLGLKSRLWRIFEIPYGTYTFILRVPGYREVQREVTISSKESPRLHFKLEK